MMKSNKVNAGIEPMDERQSRITQIAVCIGFVFLIVCLLVAMIWQLATTGDVGWELFGIIGASVVILVSRRLLGDVEQPLDHRNRPLPTGSSKADKLVRCKSYAAGSLLFGSGFAVMDVLLMLFGENAYTDLDLTQVIFPGLGRGATIVVTAVITFVSMFLVSFVFDYLVGEFYKVKRYNKMMERLDNEE